MSKTKQYKSLNVAPNTKKIFDGVRDAIARQSGEKRLSQDQMVLHSLDCIGELVMHRKSMKQYKDVVDTIVEILLEEIEAEEKIGKIMGLLAPKEGEHDSTSNE